MLNLHKSYISEFDTINQEIKAEQIEFQNENDEDHWPGHRRGDRTSRRWFEALRNIERWSIFSCESNSRRRQRLIN